MRECTICIYSYIYAVALPSFGIQADLESGVYMYIYALDSMQVVRVIYRANPCDCALSIRRSNPTITVVPDNGLLYNAILYSMPKEYHILLYQVVLLHSK